MSIKRKWNNSLLKAMPIICSLLVLPQVTLNNKSIDKNKNENLLTDNFSKELDNLNVKSDLKTIDISQQINYGCFESDWRSGHEVIHKIEPYKKAIVKATLSNLPNDVFVNKNILGVDEIKDTLLKYLKVKIQASKTSVLLRQKEYNSLTIDKFINLQDWSIDFVNLQIKTKNIFNFYKVKTVSFDKIILKPKLNKEIIHHSYFVSSIKDNYPIASLYINTFIKELIFEQKNIIDLNYDLNVSLIARLSSKNLNNNMNQVSTIIPKINFDYFNFKINYPNFKDINDPKFIYALKKFEDEIKKFVSQEEIYLTMSNGKQTQKVLVNKSSLSYETEILIDALKNKQEIYIEEISTNAGYSFDLQTVFDNSIKNPLVTFKNNKIYFNFVCRPNALNIQNFQAFNSRLKMNQKVYASQLIDDNNMLLNKDWVLNQLNMNFIINSKNNLFDSIYNLNELFNGQFININKVAKEIGLNYENNLFETQVDNLKGNIYFIAKIKNWKFSNDLSSDTIQGDFNISFKEKLKQNKDIYELVSQNYSDGNGYFLVRMKTILDNSIYQNNYQNKKLWILNQTNLKKQIYDYLQKNNLTSKTFVEKNDFFQTHIIETSQNNLNVYIDLFIDNSIEIKTYKAKHQSTIELKQELLKQIYEWEINSLLTYENQIVHKNNRFYQINTNKYQLDMIQDKIDKNKINFILQNLGLDNYFNIKISLEKLAKVLSNQDRYQDICKLIYQSETKVNSYVNWYFILLVIIIVITISLSIFWIVKKKVLIKKVN